MTRRMSYVAVGTCSKTCLFTSFTKLSGHTQPVPFECGLCLIIASIIITVVALIPWKSKEVSPEAVTADAEIVKSPAFVAQNHYFLKDLHYLCIFSTCSCLPDLMKHSTQCNTNKGDYRVSAVKESSPSCCLALLDDLWDFQAMCLQPYHAQQWH